MAIPSMGNYYERNKVKAKFAYSLSARFIIITSLVNLACSKQLRCLSAEVIGN